MAEELREPQPIDNKKQRGITLLQQRLQEKIDKTLPYDIQTFLKDCADAAAEADTDATFLFRYFSREVMPLILPDMRTMHNVINYDTDDAAVAADQIPTIFPSAIGGVPVWELINAAADNQRYYDQEYVHDALTESASTEDKVNLARRRHPSIAIDLAGILADVFRDGQVNVHTARLLQPMLRTQPPEYLEMMSPEHTLLLLRGSVQHTGDDDILCIDPTVALTQDKDTDSPTDLTKYDIEVTALKRQDYETYLQLRYRTAPDAQITMTEITMD